MTTFYEDVETWTLAAVRAGSTSFDDLVCHLPGVYPTDVHEALDRLLATGRIDETAWRRSVRRQPQHPAPPSRSALPIPHPLDFDWRFTGEAVDTLVAAIDRLARPSTDVACIGAPTLHERLSSGGRRSTLIDANPDVIAAMAALGSDRAIHTRVGCDPLPELTAGVVAIDPPWYPEHVRLFLWAASRLCNGNGIVLLSFPPAGTRPGVAGECESALAYAAEVGLMLDDIRRADLAYRSPPFERLALVAAGYPDLPEDWRRGDLLIFRARPERVRSAPPAPVVNDGSWIMIPSGPTRIKVRVMGTRRAPSAPVASGLNSIVNGDVLPTVSRRDLRRAQVSVWTACNRVYGCADVEVLIMIADAIHEGLDAVDTVAAALGRRLVGQEMDEVLATEAQLVNLLETERRELGGCSWHTDDA